jgi:pSer/pThr/pTyr-binding forkhead associated (FHA) protein
MPTLFVLASDGTWEERLDGRALTIGRNLGCDVWVRDVYVSQWHARVTVRGTSFYVEDLGSKNGTYVNGDRVTGPRRLRDCDVIRIGTCRLTFEDEPARVTRGSASRPRATPRVPPVR